MSMIEALCHGLPVISVRSRAIADLVRDGETGYVVEPDDAAGVAEAIGRLRERRTRARMGNAAARWAIENLSGEVVGRMIGGTANRLLKRERTDQ